MSEADPLAPLRAHPVFSIITRVARHVGVARDLIQVIEFLSLAAGRMVLPLNIDIVTDQWAADLFIANRMIDLLPGAVARVSTYKQFRELERTGFARLAVVLVHGRHEFRFRDFTETLARILQQDCELPSLWRITDHMPTEPCVPSTLRLLTPQTSRDLGDFGTAFATYRTSAEEAYLADLLQRLPLQPSYPNPLHAQYRSAALTPDGALVLERLLLIVAALRTTLSSSIGVGQSIDARDYAAVRALLLHLPLTPIGRRLAPQTLESADALHERVQEPTYHLPLPDHSSEGEKWFTRDDARRWLDVGYTTAKKRLAEMEDEGILCSTVAENNRERGRQIHYRFANGSVPPFGWRNPFATLPDLGGIPAE